MKDIKIVNVKPEDYILAVKVARAFIEERKPIGIRHGTCYTFGVDEIFYVYVYSTPTLIVVRGQDLE
jgi:hypothetical protein